MNKEGFELFVFHRHLVLDMACIQGGANGIIVDLEMFGKGERQNGFDTQINAHSVQDLLQIKKNSDAYTICRINALNKDSQQEIEQVIAAGADELLVPMIKHDREVKEIFRLVKERISIGIMIETKEAVEIANKLDRYPLARVYVGLNDLCISRKSNSIFAAIADGTLDKIRKQIVKAPFGFAGLTIPARGNPLPVLHLVNELLRLDCQFTFLRRSFFRDTLNKNVQTEIPRIRDSIKQSKHRNASQIKNDRISLEENLKILLRAPTDDNFNNKNILVTGAAGFVGANLVAALENDGANVFSLVRKQTDLYRLEQIKSNSEIILVDLLEHTEVNKALSSIQPEYVFHTATLRGEACWQATLNINGAAIVNLIKAIASPKLKKFVHLGSSYEYGNIETPYKENDIIQPDTFFGASKAAGTLLLQHLAKCEDLPIVILRLFHVYGRLEPAYRLIPSAIRLILQDNAVPITIPSFVRDYIHINDVIDACYKAALDKNNSGQIFNIGTGIETSNEKIVNDLGVLMGRSPKVMLGGFPSRPWERTSWCADITLARKKLAWVPNITLNEGLKKSIELYAKAAY